MPRVLQALKLISKRWSRNKVAPPTSYINANQKLLTDVSSTILSKAKSYLADTSKYELIFLTTIILTLLLLVVILPAYELLFQDEIEDDKESEHQTVSTSPSRVRMYIQGVGVVEMDPTELSDGAPLIVSSRESSQRSVGSYGSCSMETIEESEEEYLDDSGDEDDENSSDPQHEGDFCSQHSEETEVVEPEEELPAAIIHTDPTNKSSGGIILKTPPHHHQRQYKSQLHSPPKVVKSCYRRHKAREIHLVSCRSQ